MLVFVSNSTHNNETSLKINKYIYNNSHKKVYFSVYLETLIQVSVVSCSTNSFKSFIQLSDYTGCAVCVRFTKMNRLIHSGIKTTLVVLLRLIYEIEPTHFEN